MTFYLFQIATIFLDTLISWNSLRIQISNKIFSFYISSFLKDFDSIKYYNIHNHISQRQLLSTSICAILVVTSLTLNKLILSLFCRLRILDIYCFLTLKDQDLLTLFIMSFCLCQFYTRYFTLDILNSPVVTLVILNNIPKPIFLMAINDLR